MKQNLRQDRIVRRLTSQFARRALVKMTQDDAGLQKMQVEILSGEVANLFRVQDYGFTGRPHKDAQAVVMALGGRSNNYVVIKCDDRRYRLVLDEDGEVAMFDDQGQKVVLYRDRIEVEAPKVVVKSDDVHLGAEGGLRVARVGDLVRVGNGSSQGDWPIVSGSSKVRCAGDSVE